MVQGSDTRLVHLSAVAGVMCTAFSAILVALADVPPASAALFRTFYALPVLALFYLAVRKKDHRPFSSRRLAFFSGILLAIDLTLWHHAIDFIGAGLGTVLANTQVLVVGFAAWLVWKERPSRVAVLAVPVVLGGVALLSGLGGDDAFGDDPVKGILFGIGTGIFYAGFLLMFRASNRGHLAPTPGPLLDATVGAIVGATLAGLVSSDLSITVTWPEHGWLVLLALVVQVAGWLLIAYSLPRLAALETSVLLLIQPVGALFWSRLILDERLSFIQGVGAAIVLGGILVVTTRGSVHKPSPHAVATSGERLHPEPGS